MNQSYRVEVLTAAKHRCTEFVCEEPELVSFFRDHALLEMEARVSVCFVLVPLADPGRVAGFYTLSAATLQLTKLPTELKAKLPGYPNLPATLLGRLARDREFKGAGMGELLLVSALQHALRNTSRVGSMAVVTDPKNAQVEDFYRKYGFQNLGGGRRMFMTMRAIADLLGGCAETGPD